MPDWRNRQFYEGGGCEAMIILPIFLVFIFLPSLVLWPKVVGAAFLIFITLLFAFPEWASTIDTTPRITPLRLLNESWFIVLILHFVSGLSWRASLSFAGLTVVTLAAVAFAICGKFYWRESPAIGRIWCSLFHPTILWNSTRKSCQCNHFGRSRGPIRDSSI